MDVTLEISQQEILAEKFVNAFSLLLSLREIIIGPKGPVGPPPLPVSNLNKSSMFVTNEVFKQLIVCPVSFLDNFCSVARIVSLLTKYLFDSQIMHDDWTVIIKELNTTAITIAGKFQRQETLSVHDIIAYD